MGLRDQQLRDGHKPVTGPGKHELVQLQWKTRACLEQQRPSQGSPAPGNCLLWPHFHSACHTATHLLPRPATSLSAFLYTFLLYLHPCPHVGQITLRLFTFLRGKGGGEEREGETASLGLDISELVEGGQQGHPAMEVGGDEGGSQKHNSCPHCRGLQTVCQSVGGKAGVPQGTGPPHSSFPLFVVKGGPRP